VEEIRLPLPVHEGAAQAVVADADAAGKRFDTLVVRAVAPLVKLLGWFEPICDAYGRMLVIKGPRWEEEKGEARHKGFGKKVSIRRIAAWPIRGSDNESVLLEIRRRQPK
jgi:16S rRNA (guanine527-N7)-methyltransferase